LGFWRAPGEALQDLVAELVRLLVNRVDEPVIEIRGPVGLSYADLFLASRESPKAWRRACASQRRRAFDETPAIQVGNEFVTHGHSLENVPVDERDG
jgi:hypothetical protein